MDKDINKEDLRKVVDLFMNEDDLKALKKLYKITKDELVKIAIGWLEDDSEIAENVLECDTYANCLYNDIILYIWDKYELNKF